LLLPTIPLALGGALLLALLALFGAWMVPRADRNMREELLLQANLVVRGVNEDQVKALSGTSADLQNPAFKALHRQLSAVRAAHPKCRYLYLAGRREDGTIFFLVDSLPLDDENFSPPGQLYEEALGTFHAVFDTGQGSVVGPEGDRWGMWISALVPLVDRDTGFLLAVLGMDIDAQDWEWGVASRVALPGGLLVVLFFAWGGVLVVRRQSERLRESEGRQADIMACLPDATLAVDRDHRVILWNRAMEEMTAIPAAEILGTSGYSYMVPFYGEPRAALLDLVLAESADLAARYPALSRQGETLEVEVFCPALAGGQGGWIFAKAAPLHDDEGRISGAVEVLRDISAQKESRALLARRAWELERHQEAIISSMAILAEYRDKGTGAHIQRTKAFVWLLLERSGGADRYPSENFSLVWHSAALHDIGKVGVPDHILLKPGPLTEEEFEIIKLHPVMGSEILLRAEKILGPESFVAYAREITEFHHEKWDGSGYPHGLAGEEIPFIARVMAIADVYDALVTERPYKKPVSHEEAVEIIREGAGHHFDPQLVETFLSCTEEFRAIARENWEER